MHTSIDERIARYKRFYLADKGLMTIAQPAFLDEDKASFIQPPRFECMDWSSEKSVRAYAGIVADNFISATDHFDAIDDDYMPTLQVLAGTGMIGATFVKDAVLHHEGDTNYLEPPIRSWQDGVSSIGFDPDNRYFVAQMIMLREYIDRWRGRHFVLPFTHFDPLDLVNQFRGNEVFYDFFDAPDELHALLDRSTSAIMQLEAYVRGNFMEGYQAQGQGIYCWIPGGSYLSCDIGDMISPAMLQEFDIPYVERILRQWGGAYMHHHEMGIHQIATWATCTGLSVQFLNKDPNTRHLGSIVDDEIIADSRRVPINLICTADEYVQNHAYWAEGRFITWVGCKTQSQSEDIVRLAQRYRA